MLNVNVFGVFVVWRREKNSDGRENEAIMSTPPDWFLCVSQFSLTFSLALFFHLFFFKIEAEAIESTKCNDTESAFYGRTAQLHSDYTICHCHMRSISFGPQSLSQPITWFVLSIRFLAAATRNRVVSVLGLPRMPLF